MNSPQNTTGACLCGTITYKLTAPPLLTAICHCTHCQRQSGSAFSVNLIVYKKAIVVAGELASFSDTGGSGNEILRKFCGTCGSPILTEPAVGSEILYLKAGSLDDKDSVQPTIQIWCQNAQSWWPHIREIQSFDQNRPRER